MAPQQPKASMGFIPWYLLFFVFIAVVFSPLGCKWIKNDRATDDDPKKRTSETSWNVLFKEGTNQATRDKIIKGIVDSVNTFYANYSITIGRPIKAKFEKPYYCPCDTLLYNIFFRSVDGAGESVTTAPATKPTGPRGSGDYMDALVADNLPVNEPVDEIDVKQYFQKKISIPQKNVDASRKIAIIDSGLDPDFFDPGTDNLVWKDNPASTTLFNFLPRPANQSMLDETKGKHGTAVAAIILNELKENTTYPAMMILKALDKNNSGSIFSVSCALSYAIKNKAAIANLSLGYYGKPDDILYHYLKLTKGLNPAMHVFAAAGNMPGHPHSNLCNTASNTNELSSPNRLFFPACFNQRLNNITSVTQIRKVGAACYFQNYSSKLVDLGVYNTNTGVQTCCAIEVGYLNTPGYYEGSSFATPVASGLKMSTSMSTGDMGLTNPTWQVKVKSSTTTPVTINGKYIEFTYNGN